MFKADWPAPLSIKTAISTREGGVSLPPYDGLNLGSHVNDRPDAVAQNRQLFRQQLLLVEQLRHFAVAGEAFEVFFRSGIGLVCPIIETNVEIHPLSKPAKRAIVARGIGWG